MKTSEGRDLRIILSAICYTCGLSSLIAFDWRLAVAFVMLGAGRMFGESATKEDKWKECATELSEALRSSIWPIQDHLLKKHNEALAKFDKLNQA